MAGLALATHVGHASVSLRSAATMHLALNGQKCCQHLLRASSTSVDTLPFSMAYLPAAFSTCACRHVDCACWLTELWWPFFLLHQLLVEEGEL
jgi:hypothetical protein